MANYQKIPNNPGSGRNLLKNVPTTAAKPVGVEKVPSTQKELVKSIQNLFDEAAKAQRLNKIMLDSRQADVILMRMATLLEVFKKNFVDDDLSSINEELENAKNEIVGKVESLATDGLISNVFKEYLAKQIVSLFGRSATKDDIEELKAYLAEVAESTKADSKINAENAELHSNYETREESSSEKPEISSDNEESGYLDSTPAKNFFTLQTFIGQQFERLNATLAKMTTPKAATPSMVRKQSKTTAFFTKIGGMLSKVFEFLSKVITPAITFIKNLIMKFVVTPIALIAAKILLVVSALTLLVVGAILAYQFIKKKILEFVDYFTSGQLWEDVKTKMVSAWEWLKDFGKWLWDITVKALKYVFWDMWVDFGKWIWEKLVQFGKWLYDNYIGKYLVEPFKQHIWEPVKKLWNQKIWPKIEPFVISLTKLRNRIAKAFSAWDANKSIWENLKNISGIVKDSVVAWWNDSPFKVFYEKHIQPFVMSARDLFGRLKNLGGFLKQAILDWWNGDSSLGQTLSNIGTTVWNTVKEWWNGSVFKEYWDKLANYLGDLIQPLGEWYETTFLHQWISEIEKKGFGTFIKDAIAEWYEQSWLKKVVDKIQELLQVYVIAPINGIKRKKSLKCPTYRFMATTST